MQTDKQQRTIERLLLAAIATVILCGLITPLAITYYIFPTQIEQYVERPQEAAQDALPDDLQKWTPEQLEDEVTTYRAGIDVIKDEQRRRERNIQWEVVPEPVTQF